MSYEYFIARRLFFRDESGRASRPAVRIAVIGVLIGVAVMLVSVAVVMGFKGEVQRNVTGVGAHIQVTSYQSNFSHEMVPLEQPETAARCVAEVPGVRHVQVFTTKPGVIKTSGESQTVLFKGVGADYDWTFLSGCLTDGRLPAFPLDSLVEDALMSRAMASLLELETGATFVAYFTRGEQVSARRFRVVGLFDTHFPEFDHYYLLVDNRQIARLNRWEPGSAGGLEVQVDEVRRVRDIDVEVYRALYRLSDRQGTAYYTQSVYDLNPALFGWLELLDMNIWLILCLMVFVSGFNMMSGLLILVLERTRLIGILKAMGAPNVSVKKIFRWMALMLAGRGMLWGNALGLVVCALQYVFHLIPLNPDVYYVAYVPIALKAWQWLALNVGTVLLSLLVMWLPSALVGKIVPARSIRFE